MMTQQEALERARGVLGRHAYVEREQVAAKPCRIGRAVWPYESVLAAGETWEEALECLERVVANERRAPDRGAPPDRPSGSRSR